ncbi:NADH dehydrogenase (quinone) [Cystobacter fuscus DSM 2262]|uniref:NADH dehydrogenase (Quinone) n=1 Tax=Cystobacter fuscus (strain ATCC 25194 / DSM 2262 / NBRC 100088 / M29) TaxID=1242864 RepID=S9QRR1_CYSF2|nr:proton-conducting transporter membrane subunit [Cystobacter fuscus]EPX63969.1 NADH dehydrogenase (quinone) [Cystobacter fuscus DSM 2262]
MPLVLPLVGAWGLAAVLSFLDGRKKAVAGLAVVGMVGVLGASLALLPAALHGPMPEVVAGGWPVGMGIRLRADALSVLFCVVTNAVLAGALGCELLEGIGTRSFPALVLFLAAGLNGAFLTADAFNFYVFFELSMGAAFALASYGRGAPALRAGFTFVVVNLMGSVLFLTAVVMLYQATGTLDMGGIAEWVASPHTRRLEVPGALLLSAFGVKLGLFPFHFWAPAVYRGVSTSIAAIFAGALVNIGSYALVRLGPGVLGDALAHGAEVLAVLGGASLVYGSLLALARQVPAETLAYASIAQAGYLFAALGLGPGPGVAAAVLLALSGSLDKAVLFLAMGLPGTRSRAAFAAAAFSSAGLPLSLGFLAKTELLRAALLGERWWLAGFVVLSSVLSLVALARTFQRLYWAEARTREAPGRAASGVVLALALVGVGVGVWPEPLLAVSARVAGALAGGGGP